MPRKKLVRGTGIILFDSPPKTCLEDIFAPYPFPVCENSSEFASFSVVRNRRRWSRRGRRHLSERKDINFVFIKFGTHPAPASIDGEKNGTDNYHPSTERLKPLAEIANPKRTLDIFNQNSEKFVFQKSTLIMTSQNITSTFHFPFFGCVCLSIPWTQLVTYRSRRWRSQRSSRNPRE